MGKLTAAAVRDRINDWRQTFTDGGVAHARPDDVIMLERLALLLEEEERIEHNAMPDELKEAIREYRHCNIRELDEHMSVIEWIYMDTLP